MQNNQRTARGQRKIPKQGCFFSGLRISGFLLMIFGGLVLLGGIFGFVVMLFRTSSILISALQNIDQQMAPFLLVLIMTYLGSAAAVGCSGLVMIGVGFGLNLASMEVSPSTKEPAIDKLLPAA